MAGKTYTAAEKAKYWADKAAESGDAPRTRKTRSTTTPKGRKKSNSGQKFNAKTYKKRSGCKYEESYKSGDELVNRPRISGWRLMSNGLFQSFDAYLDKNDGAPRNGTSPDVCRVFVVNITTKGVGTSTETGVYSVKRRKLSITKLDLVANPHAANGGYYGRGGSRYKDKVK